MVVDADLPQDDEAALLDEVAAVERFIEDDEPGAPALRRPDDAPPAQDIPPGR